MVTSKHIKFFFIVKVVASQKKTKQNKTKNQPLHNVNVTSIQGKTYFSSKEKVK